MRLPVLVYLPARLQRRIKHGFGALLLKVLFELQLHPKLSLLRLRLLQRLPLLRLELSLQVPVLVKEAVDELLEADAEGL